MPPRVSIALRMGLLACADFFGEFASKEYTKMLVSRKNLPLIHFVPAETPAGLHMFEAFHESVVFPRAAALRRELLEPLAEQGVKGLMLRLGQEAGLFDELFVGAERDILHAKIV